MSNRETVADIEYGVSEDGQYYVLATADDLDGLAEVFPRVLLYSFFDGEMDEEVDE